jgi:hypothetical protein
VRVFIPNGYVLLTAAVDRLAEARRTADQTKDDGRNAARAELRAEFYSDSISPLVVSRSGKNYKIRPYHWGGELAPTWFEQGECWLTEYLVDPPLGMFHGKERAYIFVGEHDLQRLMAKQEVKQEAAPPRIVPARKGRPPEYDWDDGMNYAKGEFERRGNYSDPQNAEEGWRSQADLMRLVQSYMAKHNGGKEPSESEVKKHLKDLFDSSRK